MVDNYRIGLKRIPEGGLVLLLVLLYFTSHYLQSHALGPEYLRFYAKDILLVPMLIYAIYITALLLGKELQIGSRHIWITFVAVSLIFEGILPVAGSQYSSDLWDVLAYFAGAMICQAIVRAQGLQIALQGKSGSKHKAK